MFLVPNNLGQGREEAGLEVFSPCPLVTALFPLRGDKPLKNTIHP